MPLPRIITGLNTAFLSLTLAGSIVLTAPAQAQGGGMGFSQARDLERAEFLSRDLEVVVDMLGLDEAQRDIVEIFLEDYTVGFETMRQEVTSEQEMIREEIALARERGNFNWRDMMSDYGDRFEKYDRQRTVLGDAFRSNLYSVLSEDQLTRWESFERRQRRKMGLPRGLISGERVDLIELTSSLALPADERLRIEPILAEYEIQLDSALQRRDADMANAEDALREAVRGGDTDSLLNSVERQRRLRTHIRDLNENYALQVQNELAAGEVLRLAFREAAYSNVWKETWGQQVFEAALMLQSLDEDTHAVVEQLASTHATRLDQTNVRIQRVTRQEEPYRFERMITMMQARMGGGQAERPADLIGEAFEERSKFEGGMVDQLYGLLSEEQILDMPRRPTRPQQRGTFNRGGGGRGDGFPTRGGGGRRGGGGGQGGG